VTQDYLRKIEGERMLNAREIFFLDLNRYPANSEEMAKQRLLLH